MHHYKLTGLHGSTSPFLLLQTWNMPLSLLQRLPGPLKEQAWRHSTWQKGCDVNWWVGMIHRFRWILLSSCLPHTLWPILSTIHGWVAFPTLGGSLKDWTMRNSTSLTSCLQLLLRYMLNLFFFSSFPLPYLLWLLMGENCNRRSLL